MTEHRVVLITGVAGNWGRRVARRLSREPAVRIVGLDSVAPEGQIPGLTFLPADLRRRDLPALLAEARVDTVLHLAYREAVEHTEEYFEFNVLGAIGTFGAAAKAGVRRLVSMSSTGVYGAKPDNSALLREDAPLRASRDVVAIRYLLELEQFYSQFHMTAPDVELAVLRFAHIVGPTVETPMTRYLADPWSPMLLGYNPSLQFVHETDVIEALAQAVLGSVVGPVNVAARPALPLSRALALAWKLPVVVPRPLASLGGTLLAERGRVTALPVDTLQYRLLADTSKMEQSWGFAPAMAADEAIRDFAATHEQPVVALFKDMLSGGGAWRGRMKVFLSRE